MIENFKILFLLISSILFFYKTEKSCRHDRDLGDRVFYFTILFKNSKKKKKLLHTVYLRVSSFFLIKISMESPLNNESFNCRIDNSKIVTNALNCLSVGSANRKDINCYIEINADLIVFTVTGIKRYK